MLGFILFIIAFFAIAIVAGNAENKRKEEEAAHEEWLKQPKKNGGIVEYKNFKIQTLNNGDYKVSYHGEKVEVKFPFRNSNYILRRDFVFGRKITIEQVKKHLDRALEYGAYC